MVLQDLRLPPHTPKKFRRRKHATMTPFQQNLKSTTEQTGATLFHRPPTARPAPEDSSPCKTSEFEPSSFCGELSLKRALKLLLNSRKNRNRRGDFEIPERSGVLPAPWGTIPSRGTEAIGSLDLMGRCA